MTERRRTSNQEDQTIFYLGYAAEQWLTDRKSPLVGILEPEFLKLVTNL